MRNINPRALASVQRLIKNLSRDGLLPADATVVLQAGVLRLDGVEGSLAAVLTPLLSALLETKITERALATETLALYRESAVILKTALACAGSTDPNTIAQSLLTGLPEATTAAVINRDGKTLAAQGILPPLAALEPFFTTTAHLHNAVPSLNKHDLLICPLGTRDAWYAIALTVTNNETDTGFDSSDLSLTTTLCSIAAAALANAYQTAAQQTLARYLPPMVVHKLLSEDTSRLGGVELTATILVLDIRGFTALTSRLGAAETVSLLNRFFACIAPMIREKGIIDKYLGDGLLAVWGVPYPDPDSALHAVTAARRILAAAADFLPALTIGIGITHGQVIAGNIGIEARMDYTVIGSPVNEAAKLEKRTKDFGIPLLLTADAYTALPEQEQYRFEHIDEKIWGLRETAIP
jgi:class 3 adenylate cyclase